MYCAIDIGSNFGIASFENQSLVDFELFSVKTAADLCLSLEKFDCKKMTHAFIERQMRQNKRAVWLEAQVFMWFQCRAPHVVCKSFAPRLKYVNCDKTIFSTKYKRKKWATDFVKSKMTREQLKKFCALKKKDDVADAIVIGSSVTIF